MLKKILFTLFILTTQSYAQEVSMKNVYDYEVTTIEGETTSLHPYEGKVMLIVNVASKCGFTPQYEGLEKLYKKYKEQGLMILGFPCNQFGSQEPGSEKEIQNFCRLNYGVTFPVFSKIKVNGNETHPLYAHLKSEQAGILGTEAIKWNFTKFLVDKKGNVVDRFSPSTKPKELEKTISELLKQ